MTHASIFLIRIDSELGKLRNHKSESLSLAAGMTQLNDFRFRRFDIQPIKNIGATSFALKRDVHGMDASTKAWRCLHFYMITSPASLIALRNVAQFWRAVTSLSRSHVAQTNKRFAGFCVIAHPSSYYGGGYGN